MPILMPKDTRDALGDNAEKCESRSLFMDRFAQPDAKEDNRRSWFEKLLKRDPIRLPRGPIANGRGKVLYAQLQSRLMVNMAGGVMENAGLCLDRFGLPFIPGSAVKGCARRMAIQELFEAQADSKTRLLTQIALAFGWSKQDWGCEKKDDRFKSDFAFAVGEEGWGNVSAQAKSSLPEADNFAGSVSFLPARPMDIAGLEMPLRPPRLGELEMDVVTCHHGQYYASNDPNAVAPDDEDPNPVLFPAVAAGHVFAFTVLPLRDGTPDLLAKAYQWLAEGLRQFGLGAKTAAGYGWFDCSDQFQSAVSASVKKKEELEANGRTEEAEAAAKKQREEAEKASREKSKAEMAKLSPEQREDFKIAQLTDDQFRSCLDSFNKRTDKKAIVRALRLEGTKPHSRRTFWDDLKVKAQKKGGKYGQTEQLIRRLSREMFPGKEGKMP
ncbi:MAG: type III-B CRISPR module RAMP protein Cmr6 [Limisphaerales bacterium]